MTESQRARRVVDRMMHDAHRRYQRQMTRPDGASQYVSAMPSGEIRGVTRQMSKREAAVEWLPEWSTHLRPNFWKAYFETLMFMAK